MAKSPRKMVPKFYWDLKIAKKGGQRRQRRGSSKMTVKVKKMNYPYCGSAKLYRTVRASQGKYFIAGAMAGEFTLSFTVTVGDVAIADTPSTRVMN